MVASRIRYREIPVVLLLLEISGGGEGAVDQTGNLGESTIAFMNFMFLEPAPRKMRQKIKQNISKIKEEQLKLIAFL